jgi:hypothetical protein
MSFKERRVNKTLSPAQFVNLYTLKIPKDTPILNLAFINYEEELLLPSGIIFETEIPNLKLDEAFPPSKYLQIKFEGPLLKCTNCNSSESYYKRIKHNQNVDVDLDLYDSASFKTNYFRAIKRINNNITLEPTQRWFYKYNKYKKKIVDKN